ncbi:putative F-box/LRR-repeat protein 23 [Salvia splendens]|uniref:putative F-box/LRR-repeat protein 23 n=1 Tax=Salvia splendens TaxID=180675 RepID=UPI001C26376D|nr:putative F-box/LRR-repeat protein 23 [Salvia splendens]
MPALINKRSKLFNKAAASSDAPPWLELPDYLTENILLPIGDILTTAQKVCTTWRRVIKNPTMWRVINLDCRDWADKKFASVCYRIVDRSQGQLVDLKLLSYNDQDYEFLDYVAGSSKLRCLTLAGYEKIEIGLTDAIEKLPRLEELHLIRMPSLSVEEFESIGMSCPMLKSFTYIDHWLTDYPIEGRFGTEHAVAIGETMPNLHHLGLEAILDGCPHLESLDLRRCLGLDLEGALGKRCSDRIKHLRLPSDYSVTDWVIKYPAYEDNKSEYKYENGNKYECGYVTTYYDSDFYIPPEL